MEVSVLNINGQETGRKVALNDAIFGIEPNDHVIYLDVKQYLANQRQGTAKAKERSEHAGSTRKLGTAGIAFAGGGFSLNLRDMAVFGELVRNHGKLRGKQIIPESATVDVSKGGSQDAFSKSGEYPLCCRTPRSDLSALSAAQALT